MERIDHASSEVLFPWDNRVREDKILETAERFLGRKLPQKPADRSWGSMYVECEGGAVSLGAFLDIRWTDSFSHLRIGIGMFSACGFDTSHGLIAEGYKSRTYSRLHPSSARLLTIVEQMLNESRRPLAV